MTKVSIVILNWNRKKDTVECLEFIGRLRVTNFVLEIIVVDNASTDNSEALIKKSLKNLTKQKGFNGEIIFNQKNLGYTGGNNVGIKHAINHGADYLLVLNNDTLADESLLKEMLEVAKSKKDAGIFSPKIYFAKGFEFHKERYKKNEPGRVIWAAGGIIDWHNVYGINRGVDEVDDGQYDKVTEIDFAPGTCMLVKREVFERIGMFDDKYYMYLEDVKFCHLAKREGFKIYFVPNAKLWHKVAKSSGIGSELNDYFIHRNRLLFGMKYAGLRTRLALYRESLKFLAYGRKWQKRGILDFYFGNFGRGSWRDN
jgi:GT2 family glycosyltransferase